MNTDGMLIAIMFVLIALGVYIDFTAKSIMRTLERIESAITGEQKRKDDKRLLKQIKKGKGLPRIQPYKD